MQGLVAKYIYVYTCLDRSTKPVRLKTIESKIKLQILVEIGVAVMVGGGADFKFMDNLGLAPWKWLSGLCLTRKWSP